MIVCCLQTFFKITFSKHSFMNTIRVSNTLDPNQAPHSVCPDLGPNWLQRSNLPLAGKELKQLEYMYSPQLITGEVI